MSNIKIHFSSKTTNEDVYGVLFDGFSSKDEDILNRKTDGVIEKAIVLSKLKGKKGEAINIFLPQTAGIDSVVIAGKKNATSFGDFREIGGFLVRSLPKNTKKLAIFCDQLTEEQALGFIFGVHSRLYCFDKYITEEKRMKYLPESITVIENNGLKDRYNSFYKPIVESIHLARDLGNEPANILNPVTFSECIKSFESLGLDIDIFGEQDLKKFGMNAMLCVGQGSSIESRMVVISWNGGDSNDPPLSIIGKGVCFDSGGLSLKPSESMESMKNDMDGAAIVVGLLCALAKRKAKVNVVGLVGLVENMPDGSAQRPGDIVKTMSGQTVEVLNTDAEGRLVLCDILTYCQKMIKPRAIIDLATLTGAILVALGHEYAGVFSDNKKMISDIKIASKKTGDLVWHMPFHEQYDRDLDSDVADIRNIGHNRNAGSAKAAHFLKRFLDKSMPWMHMDIAGTAYTLDEGLPYNTKGSTGYGIALLNEWVRQYEL